MSIISASSETTSQTISFLSWSSLLCNHVQEDSLTSSKELYQLHQKKIEEVKCSWFIQTRKTQESRLVKEHTQRERTLTKQKAKIKKEARIVKKHAEEYACRRCRCSKFDSNIKLHQHIRERHAKKSKSASITLVTKFDSERAFNKDSDSHLQLSSLLSSSSSKLVVKSLAISITSRSSRISIRVVSSFTSSSSSSFSSPLKKTYLIMNDLSQMFVEKSKSLDLHHLQYSSYQRKSLRNTYNRRSNFLTVSFDASFLHFDRSRSKLSIMIEMNSREKTIFRIHVESLFELVVLSTSSTIDFEIVLFTSLSSSRAHTEGACYQVQFIVLFLRKLHDTHFI